MKLPWHRYVLGALALFCLAIGRFAEGALACGLATFLWLVLFVLLTRQASSRRELIVLGALFALGYVLRFWGALGMPAVTIPAAGVGSLLPYLMFLLYRRVTAEREMTLAHTLLFPLLWLFGFLLCSLLQFPSFMRVDFWFFDLRLLLQSEALIGSWGLSFLLLWAASLVAFALEKRRVSGLVGFACIAAALLVFGGIRLSGSTVPDDSVTVAYTTGPYVGDFLDFTSLDYERAENCVRESALAAKNAGADILVFNEEAFELESGQAQRLVDCLCARAKENGLHILVGLDVYHDGEEKSENKILLIDDRGEVSASYLKTHLIPVLESSYLRGDGELRTCPLMIDGREIKVSFAICYDSNFAGFISRSDPEADLLLLPSWDWDAITALHARICGTLAVENGMTVLKPTYDGCTVAVDPYGRVLTRSDTDDTGFETVHVVDLPVPGVSTPYHRLSHAVQSLLNDTGETISEGVSDEMLLYALLASEAMGALICIVLLFATWFETKSGGFRRTAFILLSAAGVLTNLSDMLSWLLDGRPGARGILFASTVAALLGSFLLYALFHLYVFALARETEPLSHRHLYPLYLLLIPSCIWTVTGSFSGRIFTMEGAAYASGPAYGVYLLLNALVLVYVVVDILLCLRYLRRRELVTILIYLILPVCEMVLNYFIPDYSFAYPVISVSLLIAYVMLQANNEQALRERELLASAIASHDPLTGLRNRRACDELIDSSEKAERSGVIFCDVNGLKYRNDHYGHKAGDELLCEFADVLRSLFREEETFRISGDEFLILLRDVPEEEFKRQLGELRERVLRDEGPIASIGSAYGTQSITQLSRLAEEEMYLEKEKYYERYPDCRR